VIDGDEGDLNSVAFLETVEDVEKNPSTMSGEETYTM
jgi:hypothetical protein